MLRDNLFRLNKLMGKAIETLEKRIDCKPNEIIKICRSFKPIFNILNSLNNDKKLALSMTIPKDYLLPIQSFLFPVGLVFVYRQDNSISETSLVARNEQLWNTSLEKQNLYQYKSMESNNLSSNYLPMLLFLKSSYLLNNEADKLIHIDKEIVTIAEKSGKVSFIKKH